MGERHADALFSAAYDGVLDDGARRRFDSHLAGCEACESAWADYRAALDAVRALPAMTMPATVRLPVGPPQLERGRAAWLARWRGLLHPQPVWAAAGLAAVSIAAVALAAHHGRSTVDSTATSGPMALSNRAPQPAPVAGAGSQFQAIAPVACPVTDVTGASGGAAPSGYSHATRSTVAAGRELVLATPSDTYAAGASVPIYARLTGTAAASGGNDVVPCVTLETVPSSKAAAAPAPYAAPGAQGGTALAPDHSSTPPPTPIAVATAQPGSLNASARDAQGSTGSTSALLNVVIPPDTAPGTVLRLVAFIPSYAKGNTTGRDLQVELFITVR
jgi:anti-sigma factor RsiW